MNSILKNKKVVFFDVGYTLDYPASGSWVLTKAFYDIAGEKLDSIPEAKLSEAFSLCVNNLLKNHKLKDMEEECKRFESFYSEFSEYLGLGLTQDEMSLCAHDRTYNMANYIPYPDAKKVVEELSHSHKLGIISDTWPSIEPQLEALGLNSYFSFRTYSFAVGALKPDKRIFLDALQKCGCDAKDTVFIDDSVANLEGAAALGITPILIAANPASDIETSFCKIHSLTELL